MLKRRKRGRRNRRKTIFLLLLTIVFMLTAGPFVWRLEKIRQAKDNYDVQKVQEELHWFERNAGLLNKLGIIRDTQLWLELNMGGKDLESKLASYTDEKHQFWLLVLYLQDGKLITAQNVLDIMSESNLKLVGEGLLSLSNGDVQQARRLLTATEINWKSLSIDEQTIRHLTLAHAALAQEDLQAAQSELAAAQQLSPNNPACLSMAFDVALEEEQWTKAFELSQSIDAQTWRPKNRLYETKKAILSIHHGNLNGLTDSLVSLQELPKGEVYITYVKGIQALAKGQVEIGENLLKSALDSGLQGELNQDAKNALNQVIDRQKADFKLRSIVAETS
ncbi:MAG TPA: hypothetical protein DEF42_09710 [Desulfosporosinus sp.]|nr:hypothetical protein [Desulfosporosinus sp.]